MRIRWVAIVLTVVNLVILVVALVLVLKPAVTPDVAEVLRGHALEVLDSRGKVRMQVIVEPAGTVNGEAYPETVLLRLVNPDGLPAVKIATSAGETGFLLSRKAENAQGWSGVQILAEESGGVLRLVSQGGLEQLIEP